MTLQIKMVPIVPPKPIGNIAQLFTLLHNGVRDQAAEGVRFMSQYPPKPAGSTYRRTGILRRSWTFVIKSGGKLIEGLIQSSGNIAPYNKTVQGAKQTQLFNDIGWHGVKDLENLIQRDFQRTIDASVKRAFR